MHHGLIISRARDEQEILEEDVLRRASVHHYGLMDGEEAFRRERQSKCFMIRAEYDQGT